MPIFEGRADLMAYVQNVTLPEISEKIENINEDILQEKIRTNVYSNASSSDFYENTFSLLNALNSSSIKYGSDIDIQTFIDENMLTYNYESYYDGNADNRENIVKWLNDGHGGYYKGYSINYEGRHFIEDSQKEINLTMKKRISNFLRNIGYKLSK